MVATEFQNHLHISHTQLDTFLNCPWRYRYQYVLGAPWEHLPAALAFGRAIHAAVAHYYRHVKHFGEPLPLGVLKGCFQGEFGEALSQGLRVGNSAWNPPVVAVPEVRDAIGAAIVTSIQGGDVKAAVNKAAADTKRIMAETEKR